MTYRRTAIDRDIDLYGRRELDTARSWHVAPAPTVPQKPGMYRSYPSLGAHLLGFFGGVVLSAYLLWHFAIAPIIDAFEGF